MSDEMTRVLEVLKAQPSNEDQPIEQQRENMEALAGAAPMAEGTVVETVDADGVPGAWLRPPGVAEDAALLYLHGGGYCIGSVVSHTPMASKLGAAARVPVLIVDYRRGPEHRFPAAIDDAVTAFRWLVGQGFAPERLAIAGDSAGGGLTMATLLALREDGGPLPGAAACLSPWFDLTMGEGSVKTNAATDPMLSRERLQTLADWYLGDADPRQPLASPRFADLSGLPPVLIHVAEEEILRDECRIVADAIAAAGGTVEFEAWPGAFHVWHATAGLVPEADQAVDAVGRFLVKHR